MPADLGAMYTYTPNTPRAECSRVWGTMLVFTHVSRPQPMQTLTQETREKTERNENQQE